MVVRFALRASRPPGRAPPVMYDTALITGRLLFPVMALYRSLHGSYSAVVVPSRAPASPHAAPRTPRRTPPVLSLRALTTGRLLYLKRLCSVLCVGYTYPEMQAPMLPGYIT